MSDSPFKTIVYEKRGPVAHVVLNRPDVINAFNIQMRDDLSEVLVAIKWDPDVRAVLLSGAGNRGFCAGADLSEFGSSPSQTEARAARWERDIFGELRDLKIPTVAALHGHVIGSGVELALLCDIRIAAEDAVFSMPETYYGLIAAAGGTQTLQRAIRRGRALDLLLTGKRINATEARNASLVQRVVASSQLKDESERITGELAANDPTLIAAIKAALAAARDLPLRDGLARERRLSIMLGRSSEGI
ncbi:MAG: enoyl-CoA hydratase/isomerase family protein [Chloroflexi bacterium]|jgi:enoyl-CoA hydratase/carnithine racemase|nr:enoyl-CoA hydratase/isomerase family protein [Chloroflexota bacterium]MBT4073897.1 enoyl-CoA hydratase/isomerase family protein [Chloroflexota bacterium]MBT4515323.1 enoyl-CoA hydratase/isomerase family protein [Chloroflexota bacterium]MBT5318925.1 enoyl-CoA hydratase/isomerase family protein [Chloroflexota bacterium]MBT6683162.1 enoyl-CoA hydratase/isomerase family protein [Chloroflexota bacterium]